mgnify:FL=1
MMNEIDTYEVYAIRYAHNPYASTVTNFIGGDSHDVPMPLDYFIWVVKGRRRTFVIDTGFDREMAGKRNRDFLRSPGEGLKMMGIDAETVEDVIITHMHYDHAGNYDLFPKAKFHLQDTEMAYCTGRSMCHHGLRHPFEVSDVLSMVRKIFDGRVCFHDGTAQIAPGLTVHLIGGHSRGLQVVRVWTRRGWVMVASDASHFYAHFEQGRVFPVTYSVGDTLEGYSTLRRLVDDPLNIIPGHDPIVMTRYPAAAPGLEGIAVRLDADPKL